MTVIYLTEEQKKTLAEEAHLDEFLKGYDVNELFALWMLVGRAYQAANRDAK